MDPECLENANYRDEYSSVEKLNASIDFSLLVAGEIGQMEF